MQPALHILSVVFLAFLIKVSSAPRSSDTCTSDPSDCALKIMKRGFLLGQSSERATSDGVQSGQERVSPSAAKRQNVMPGKDERQAKRLWPFSKIFAKF